MRRSIIFKTLIAIIAFASMAQAGPATEGFFEVHEWGTFTSVQGSDGLVVGGLQHEEEKLPSFVGSRLPNILEPGEPKKICHKAKGEDIECYGEVGIKSEEITQKMETPVIYFHTDRDRSVTVDVSFPQGVISQFYPLPSKVLPLGSISSLGGGYNQYRVLISNTAKGPLEEVSSESVYAPARNVTAANVFGSSGMEKFIFYRGLGNFQNRLSIVSGADDTLVLTNDRVEKVPAAFLVRVTESGGAILSLGEINRVLTVPSTDVQGMKTLDMKEFFAKAEKLLLAALNASGLNEDESLSMLNTWKKSYFRTPGLRVLYILPRAETDDLLPLNIVPMPQKIVRTLVGRVEVMLLSEEQIVLRQIRAQQMNFDLASLGRFAEPKLRRLMKVSSVADYTLLSDLITKAANIP